MANKRFKVAINGFGRIGRSFARIALDDPGCPFEIVAINDLTDAKTLAHLFKYDSVHRTWKKPVKVADGGLEFDGQHIRHLLEKDAAKLPWKELGVDLVVESTGRYTDRDKAVLHLDAGAKRVVISAPAKGPDITVVHGINSREIKPEHTILSAASCTTTCLAPVVKTLNELTPIIVGNMTTIHAYTNDQVILDGPHKDLRRARAAAVNMVPTSTGAAKAIGLVVPALAGKLNGVAIRVPVCDVSCCDIALLVEKPTSAEEINTAMRAAADGPLAGAMRVNDDPIVSGDLIGESCGSVFDATLTSVQNGTFVKIVAWYDNEWGYTSRFYELVKHLAG